MSRKLYVLIGVIWLVGLLAVACGPGGGGGAPPPGADALVVTITGTEFAYSPTTINAKPGQKVNITLKNNGTVEHTLDIKDVGVKLDTQPGTSQTKSFIAPTTPGTYKFNCDIPGHTEAGMVGTLIVQ